MDQAYLFITAKDVSVKQLNELTVETGDWLTGDGDSSYATLVMTKDDFPGCFDPKGEFKVPVNPDFPSKNEWVGASVKEIEEFMYAQRQKNMREVSGHFLIIDDEGMEKQMGILVAGEKVAVDRAYDLITEGKILYAKVRVFWEDLYTAWCNIDVSNAGPENFGGSTECDEDGWYEPSDKPDGLSEEQSKFKEKLLEEVRSMS